MGMALRLMGWTLALGALLVSLVVPPAASATEATWRAIERPGHIVLMRHTEAPGVGDPPGLDLTNCATQRNLDANGRAQARRIGEQARKFGVTFERVLSSAWCRCLETGRLMTGTEPTVLPSLNSFFGESQRGPQQIEQLRRDIKALPRDETVLLVTHQVVVTGLTGLNPASGEMVVLERKADDSLAVVGRILVR
jgi:phosphohistidine phosphatase SixA